VQELLSWAGGVSASCVVLLVLAGMAHADVVVLTNRSSTVVKFAASRGPGTAKAYELGVGDLLTLTCRPGDRIQVAFMSAGKRQDYTLEPNSIFFFHRAKEGDRLDLQQISLEEHAQQPEAASTTGDRATSKKKPARELDESTAARTPPPLAKVKVKILADDDEKAVRAIWEERLRKRIADASKIFEKYAGITLEVVACETWTTPREVADFDTQLRNFESQVDPAPADLAIGFASQFAMVTGRTHLGGTRGPLARHIMLREWSRQVSEPERLELLVHELGHHFGAVHSPEMTSVMRPVLADRKALARRFLILFDPLNTLAMNLVAEEIRDHQIERIYQVSPRARDTLVSIYLALGQAFPEDPAASQYLAMLGESPPVTARSARKQTTLVDSARRVRDAIVTVADRNRRLSRAPGADGGQARLVGDALTERYVRAAAQAALALPVERRYKAFSLGLAVALGDTDMFLSNSLTKDLLGNLENPHERERRLEVIGAPTLLGRNDLARHFVFSAAMTALSSAKISESAGLLKEMRDSQGESGFSFTDLAADLAGIALAEYVNDSEERLREVAQSFTVAKFMPGIEGLREGLSFVDFQQAYGSTSDPRFLQEVDQVRQRVKKLPIYATTAAKAESLVE